MKICSRYLKACNYGSTEVKLLLGLRFRDKLINCMFCWVFKYHILFGSLSNFIRKIQNYLEIYYLKIYFFSILNNFLEAEFVANHKPFNCSASNDNPYEPPKRNLLNSYLREMDCYA